MIQIGVVEGFFGPAWNSVARKSYASFLSTFGGDFYYRYLGRHSIAGPGAGARIRAALQLREQPQAVGPGLRHVRE